MSTWYGWFGLLLGISIVLYIVRDFFLHKRAQNRVIDELLDIDSKVEMSFDNAERGKEGLIDRGRITYENDNELSPESNSNSNKISDSEEVAKTSDELIDNKENDIISVSVMSRSQDGFPGDIVAQEMMAANLYYGKFNAFHRLKNEDGTGDILFSVVSVKEPGVFDLENMSDQKFDGITLFFKVSKFTKSMDTLDILIKTAKQLAFKLNGELVDAQHKPMNKNTLETYKDMIKKIV